MPCGEGGQIWPRGFETVFFPNGKKREGETGNDDGGEEGGEGREGGRKTAM